MDKAKETKEAKDREMTQLLQSCRKHRRRGIVSQEGHNVQYCQDCNKIFYDKEI